MLSGRCLRAAQIVRTIEGLPAEALKKGRVLLLGILLLIPGIVVSAAAQEEMGGTAMKHGRLHVEGTLLKDARGETVTLKGVSTHGINWYPDYVNEDAFRTLRDEWGVDLIRLAMYTEEYNGYCAGGDREALKEVVRRGVEAATELGMYVIIDWHILSDGNPEQHQDEAAEFFDEMSRLYGGHTNVIYEVCNEPNGDVTWEQVKAYAEKIIGVIRANDAENLILVGSPTWSQRVDLAAANPITGYENILYTLHFYAATHKAPLRLVLERAVGAGLPVFVSEFGICDASGNGVLDKDQAEAWIRLLKEKGVSYVIWNLSNKDERSALLKKDAASLCGFPDEELNEQGLWYKYLE